jgi:hypothetical protein
MGLEHVDGGAYVTARTIFENELWRHPAQHRIFEYIRGRAIFAPEGYDIGGVHVPRGSFLHSFRQIAEGTAWIEKRRLKQYSISTIKAITDELIVKGRLTKDETALCTVWHVTNFDKYQSFDTYKYGDAERGCRTPKTLNISNVINRKTGADDEQANGVAEQVPNNNKNVYECSLLGKAENFLNEKGIKFSSFVLVKRLQSWEKLYEEAALNEAFSKAADAWTSQGLTGDFIRYLNTILNNDYPKLTDGAKSKVRQDPAAA